MGDEGGGSDRRSEVYVQNRSVQWWGRLRGVDLVKLHLFDNASIGKDCDKQ